MTRRIVHLGIGNFHRAHQAWYTQKAASLTGEDWRITGVSLKRDDTRRLLAPQKYAYTLELQSGGVATYEKISVIDRVIFAPDDYQAVLEAMADPACSLITLTVTEKGYCLRPSDRRLDLEAPAMAADLAAEEQASAIGLLFAGLALRHARGGAALTVICCDNLPSGGALLKQALLDFGARKQPSLAAWLGADVAFPSCMVDRIVPATTEDLRQRVLAVTGMADAWPVMAEDFSQWVIEDRFAGPRPAWEKVGVEIVADVAPYELRKLRMLNGAHSTLAYFGLAAGKTTVAEAVADPGLLTRARAVMLEAAESLPAASKVSAPDYARQLVERFANPGLKHPLRQIAMDGSQKLPIRTIAPLRERLSAAVPSPALESVLGAWLAFVVAELGAGRALDDPLAANFGLLCKNAADRAAAVDALLGVRAVFGDLFDLHPDARLRIAAAALAQG